MIVAANTWVARNFGLLLVVVALITTLVKVRRAPVLTVLPISTRTRKTSQRRLRVSLGGNDTVLSELRTR